MRTFEFRDSKSNKFWNIELQGTQFTVTYGKIGAKGQTQTKSFGDDARARKEHDKLVAEKLGKGYVETTVGTGSTSANDRQAFERSLAANPDDRATHAAYADWLTEQGDPRGEFIQVQLALEEEKRGPGERKELQAREKELLDRHQREWLGELAPYLLDQKDVDEWRLKRGEGYRFAWARGWLDTVEVPMLRTGFARLLGQAPAARLLRRLAIEGNVRSEDDPDAEGKDVQKGRNIPHCIPFAGLRSYQAFVCFRLVKCMTCRKPVEIVIPAGKAFSTFWHARRVLKSCIFLPTTSMPRNSFG
jgi:uncharacterized protein (TIGR02996 family)